MFVILVKIKKYLIYLFLFLFFNCIFTSTLKAENNTTHTVDYDVTTGTLRFIRGITFSDDGEKMFLPGSSPKNKIVQFDLDPGFDLSTASESAVEIDKDDRKQIVAPYSIRFNNDGSKMFFVQLGGELVEFSLGTNYDITSCLLYTSPSPRD